MKPVVIGAMAVGLAFAGAAMAKLPPLTDAQKAAAAEGAAKAAHANKVAAYEQCESENRVAAKYIAVEKAKGKTVTPPQLTQPCVNPGSFQPAGAATPAPAATPAAATAPAAAAKK